MSLKKHFEDLRGQTGGAQGKAAICCDIFKVQEREAVSDTHTVTGSVLSEIRGSPAATKSIAV